MSRAINLSPRERRWLSVMGWLVGLALFVRFTQILPCCQQPSFESLLRSGHCDAGVSACPRYTDCVPR